jgi:hypothetical protein
VHSRHVLIQSREGGAVGQADVQRDILVVTPAPKKAKHKLRATKHIRKKEVTGQTVGNAAIYIQGDQIWVTSFSR